MSPTVKVASGSVLNGFTFFFRDQPCPAVRRRDVLAGDEAVFEALVGNGGFLFDVLLVLLRVVRGAGSGDFAERREDLRVAGGDRVVVDLPRFRALRRSPCCPASRLERLVDILYDIDFEFND